MIEAARIRLAQPEPAPREVIHAGIGGPCSHRKRVVEGSNVACASCGRLLDPSLSSGGNTY
jgi:hypothetical protein